MSDRIELEVTCRHCDRPWTPMHHDYVAGTWRICPRCRAPDAEKDPQRGITRNARIKRVQGRETAQGA